MVMGFLIVTKIVHKKIIKITAVVMEVFNSC